MVDVLWDAERGLQEVVWGKKDDVGCWGIVARRESKGGR